MAEETKPAEGVAALQAADAATAVPVLTGRFLYHSDYYDGPRSGAMLADDRQRYWFALHPDCEEFSGYWYALYALTTDEWDLETRRHQLFQQHVGTHCDYPENGRRDLNGVRPRAEWDKFYNDPELGGFRTQDTRWDYTSRPCAAVWDPRGNRPGPAHPPTSEASQEAGRG